jgi:hypothetical protein
MNSFIGTSHFSFRMYGTYRQGCGSGSGLNDFVDPDPESGSIGKKNEEKMHFSLTFYRKHFYS